MAIAVRTSENSVHEAKKHSRIDHRLANRQIEPWATIGKCAG